MEQIKRSERIKEGRKNTIEALLPGIEELKPIDSNSTFADCGYDKGVFQDQSVKIQLKIACDVVRQANLIDYWPAEDGQILSGNCSTTTEWLADYIEKLNIPGEVHIVSVKKNPFDGEWRKNTMHIVVLHKDTEGNYRTVDPTSMVGYGYGTVGSSAVFEDGKLTSIHEGEDQIYEDVVLLKSIDLEVVRVISNLRNDFYKNDSATIESSQETIKTAARAQSGDHMDAWLSEAYYILAVLQEKGGFKQESQQSISQAIQLNPLKPKVLELSSISTEDRDTVESTLKEYKKTVVKMGSKWQELAKDIFKRKDKTNYQNAIRYKQWAFRELKGVGGEDGKKPFVQIDGKRVYLYNINPRILNEHGLTVVWIKPNSSIAGAYSAARETVTEKGRSIFEYEIDLTKPLDQGVVPLTLSHPHGERKQNVLAYGGPTSILLIKNTPAELEELKENFRESWGKNLREVGRKGKKTKWFGEREITWDSVLTNYIHTTDSSSEAAVHLLLGFPHLSLVSRWDYPHPNL
jgi:hypothetical protein